MERLIIASAGQPASGKGTLADKYFAPRGFAVVSGSSILRQWAAQEGVQLHTRRDYDEFHKHIRKQRGSVSLAEAMLANEATRLHIDGIRNFGDFMRIKQAGGYVVALECPIEKRFMRGLLDKSHRHPPSMVDFYELEQREYNDPDPNGSHTAVVMDLADHTVNAALPLRQVIEQVDAIVTPLL